MTALREPPVPWGDDGHPQRQRRRRRTIDGPPCSRAPAGDHARGVGRRDLVPDGTRGCPCRREAGSSPGPGGVDPRRQSGTARAGTVRRCPRRSGVPARRPDCRAGRVPRCRRSPAGRGPARCSVTVAARRLRRPPRTAPPRRPAPRPAGTRARRRPPGRSAHRGAASPRGPGEPRGGRGTFHRAPGDQARGGGRGLGSPGAGAGRSDPGDAPGGDPLRSRASPYAEDRPRAVGGPRLGGGAELGCHHDRRQWQREVGRSRGSAARRHRTCRSPRIERGSGRGGARSPVAGERTAGLPGLTATRPAPQPACALSGSPLDPSPPRSNG
jgi:hypothetical protein